MNYVFFKLYHMDSWKKINKNTTFSTNKFPASCEGKQYFSTLTKKKVFKVFWPFLKFHKKQLFNHWKNRMIMFNRIIANRGFLLSIEKYFFTVWRPQIRKARRPPAASWRKSGPRTRGGTPRRWSARCSTGPGSWSGCWGRSRVRGPATAAALAPGTASWWCPMDPRACTQASTSPEG